MTRSYCNKGLDDRCRDGDGTIRRKRRDALVGTLREEYGESFAEGYRRDAQLGTVLTEEGMSSLSELLRRGK